ncbi:MAG: alkaline phosphatase D family protein [Acidobacteriota bacterium]
MPIRSFLLVLFCVPMVVDADSFDHGLAIGDVTSQSAVIWSRAETTETVLIELDTTDAFSAPVTRRVAPRPDADHTLSTRFDDLTPATRYHVRVGGDTEHPVLGTFTTAPALEASDPIRFLVGGDVGGQGYCRHVDRGYDIFTAMASHEPDFFVANGDMIYADGDCPADGPGDWRNIPGDFPAVHWPPIDWTDAGRIAEIMHAHWRYNRADPHHRDFLARTPIYAQWDDHEVINDFGAAWQAWSPQLDRPGYPTLVTAGRDALFAWNPFDRHPDEPDRIYRAFDWGSQLDLILLDARSYRDLNDLAARPENPKTMLGHAQRDWLIERLTTSQARWKVVSSDVPLSLPTGSNADLYGRDGFANGPTYGAGYGARTGFEAELLDILRALDAADVDNLVFVVTDVHFAMVLRYAIDLDGDGDLLHFHEVLSGPLNAVTLTTPPQLDPTLKPTILFAEGDIFNYAQVQIDDKGHLTATIHGSDGAVRDGSRLDLEPR